MKESNSVTLDSHSLKIFARDIRFLARVGNELHMEFVKDRLIIQVLNSGNTCICSVIFNNYFFSQYNFAKNIEPAGNKCRISSRPLLQALRTTNNVVNCRIRLDYEKERLIIDVVKPKDIQFQYAICVLEHEELDDPVMDHLDNTIVCQPLILSNLLNNIPKKLRELSFHVTEAGIEISNHISHPDKDVQTVRLKFNLDPAEFTTYDVVEDSKIIINFQDFLAIVELAEVSSTELKISFSENGKPMRVSIESDACHKIEMILSTILEDTLQKLRNPLGASSYKQLMGSYIESRLSAHGTDTEVQRAMNPRVESFGSHALRKTVSDNALRHHKRKSTEMDADMPNIDNATDDRSIENGKKPRSEAVLSQKELEEVAQIMQQVSHLGDVDDEDEALANELEPESDIFAGMEDFRIPIRAASTIDATPSLEVPETQDNQPEPVLNQENRHVEPESERFQAELANMHTEFLSKSKLGALDQQPAMMLRNRKTSTEYRLKRTKAVQAKKIFVNIRKSNPLEEVGGVNLCDNSDPEDSVSSDCIIID